MKSKVARAILLMGLCLQASCATSPTMRASTVGTIAASATDATPLDKGAAVPTLTLKSADGKAIDLNAAISSKPTVLIFYRGGWCPICMRQLSGMESVLDELKDAGYQLLAISPDKPEELTKTIEKDQLSYTLLSDSDASAIKAFGLAYLAAPSQFATLEQYSGAADHALPVPAVYILGTDGTVKFAHYDPDYKVRMNPSEVLEQAKAALPK